MCEPARRDYAIRARVRGVIREALVRVAEPDRQNKLDPATDAIMPAMECVR
jgi:hypothetical protein